MKIGTMDYVVKGVDDAQTFARARELGLDGVELNLKVAELKVANHPRVAELNQLRKQHELEIPSLVLGEHNSGGLATWWRGPEAAEEIRLAIDWCGHLGASTLLVPFFFFNEPKGRAHREALAEKIKPVCEYAAEKGVTFAFEGVLPASQMIELAARVNSPAFGVYYDPANATWCDFDVASDVRQLAGLVRQVHLKDALHYTGDAALGQGRVKWDGLVRSLQDIGYERWLVLETIAGPIEDIAKDVAFARRAFGI